MPTKEGKCLCEVSASEQPECEKCTAAYVLEDDDGTTWIYNIEDADSASAIIVSDSKILNTHHAEGQ
jgi:hypothetical protein